MSAPDARPRVSAASAVIDQAGSGDASRSLGQSLLYETAYTWLVLGSTLDVLLTGVLLYGLNGIEANPIAAVFIEHWGLVGASLFKFAMVMLAIILCENVGRLKQPAGMRLSWVMAGISFIPVAWSLTLLYGTITFPALQGG